jgi:peroxiredoxin
MRHTLVALALVLAGCRPPPAAEPLLPADRAAVQLTLPRLGGGGSLSLEAQRGRPVVLTLFTTWCFRCQAEAPSFQRLHERFAARGLLVVGIALNAGGTRPAELVRLYVEETGFRFPVLVAAPDDLELVGGLGRTPEIPRTLLLDREGRILLDQVGETRFAALEAAVLRLLGEAPTRRAPGSVPTR